MEKEVHFTGKDRENLCLLLKGGDMVRLHAVDIPRLKRALEQRSTMLGLTWQEIPNLAMHDERGASFLSDGEEVTCCGKMWHLMSPTGIMAESWKPGHLYLTNKRLCWWYDFEGRVGFETPLGRIAGSVVEIRGLGAGLRRGKVLDIICQSKRGRELASFSGDDLLTWERALNEIASGGDFAPASEVETCPHCGREAATTELLHRGCDYCGWVSPRLRRQLERSALQGIPRQ